jgi:hypothetical protein
MDEATVQVFKDDDAGYEEWLDGRDSGHIASRRGKSGPFTLHVVGCDRVTTRGPERSTWTGGYKIKVCGPSRAALQRHIRDLFGVGLQVTCNTCRGTK